MPDLRCTVQTCVHNQQFLCDLDSIEVGGRNAKTAGETCCGSFQERTGDSYSNSSVTGQASDLTKVDCKATECTYNEHRACHAGKSVQREVMYVIVMEQNVRHLHAIAK